MKCLLSCRADPQPATVNRYDVPFERIIRLDNAEVDTVKTIEKEKEEDYRQPVSVPVPRAERRKRRPIKV